MKNNSVILQVDSEYFDVNHGGKKPLKRPMTYEKCPNEFDSLPQNGVPSNFTGRRIRYSSSVEEYLNRGQTYYFRIRQKTGATTSSGYSVFEQVIYT